MRFMNGMGVAGLILCLTLTSSAWLGGLDLGSQHFALYGDERHFGPAGPKIDRENAFGFHECLLRSVSLGDDHGRFSQK